MGWRIPNHCTCQLFTGLGKSKSYFTTYFKIPLCVFIREMISYLVLLALHLAICVEPSKLSFSGLEWAILVFFTGRLLTEMNQIIDVARKSSEHRITGFSLLRAKLNRLKFNYIRYEYIPCPKFRNYHECHISN